MDLRHGSARRARVDGAGDEDMPHAAAVVVGDHRAAVVVRREGKPGRISGNDLRRASRDGGDESEKGAAYPGHQSCDLHLHKRLYRIRPEISLPIFG